jgi:hypothetical protein
VAPGQGWTRRVLSVPPLPELGRISYGVYLWHWPVVVFLDEARTGLAGWGLVAIRAAVTVLVSIASYELVERPVRHHRWPFRRAALSTVAAIAAMALVIVVVTPVRANPDEAAPTAPAGNRFALRPGESAARQRVLVVGDSVANGLGIHYHEGDLGHPVVMRTAARLGCGLGASRDPECLLVLEQWKTAVEGFDPDVTVVVPGSWDLLPELLPDRDGDGHPLRIRSREYEHYLMRRLDKAFEVLTSRGGRVALFTLPCYVLVVRSKSPKMQDIDWLNRVLRAAAAKAGDAVKVIDYGNYLCPNGEHRPEIDGVHMRYDGVHLTDEGAGLVWRWVGPQLPSRKR